MNPGFSLKPLPAITFGLGCLDRLSEIGESLGSRVLIITGDSFRPRQKNWAEVEKKLLENGTWINYLTVSSEPSPEIIDLLKLPCLSEYGATPEDLDALLDGASLKNNPAPLSNEDIRKILLHRL